MTGGRKFDGWRPWKHLSLGAAVLLGLTGCAGYRLGPTNDQAAGARSIQINPFQNKVMIPRLGDSVTHALRKSLQEDGTFALNTHKDGDIVVSGTVVDYDRGGLSYQQTDVITPRDFRITIVAEVTAIERASGKLLLFRRVTGHTTIRIGRDLVSAERQALPLAADDLARNATALLADGQWW